MTNDHVKVNDKPKLRSVLKMNCCLTENSGNGLHKLRRKNSQQKYLIRYRT